MNWIELDQIFYGFELNWIELGFSVVWIELNWIKLKSHSPVGEEPFITGNRQWHSSTSDRNTKTSKGIRDRRNRVSTPANSDTTHTLFCPPVPVPIPPIPAIPTNVAKVLRCCIPLVLPSIWNGHNSACKTIQAFIGAPLEPGLWLFNLIQFNSNHRKT